jgi:hypothetical protein
MGSSLSYEGRPVLHTFRLSALVRKWKREKVTGSGHCSLRLPLPALHPSTAASCCDQPTNYGIVCNNEIRSTEDVR